VFALKLTKAWYLARQGFLQGHGKNSSLDVQFVGYPLRLIMIDHIALTWVSGEVVTQVYWHLKKESPFSNTILITIANGRVGYIVDDAGYDTPTFETRA